MEDVSQETKKEEAQPEAKKSVESSEKVEGELSAIEQGQAILDGIKKEKEELAELTKRNEAVATRMMLGGKADAGQVIKTPEQTDAEQNEADIKETMDRFD